MRVRKLIGPGLFVAALAILALCRPAPAFAVSTITISPGGAGVFLLQGSTIDGASAFDISVAYDTATLANPRVTEGPLISGAMSAINPNVPGIVRIVLVRVAPVKGSGVIATVTFDRVGASAGRISSMSVKLANAAGAPLPSQVLITNPADASVNAETASQDHGTPSVAAAAAPSTAAGTPAAPSTSTAPPATTPATTLATTPALIIAVPATGTGVNTGVKVQEGQAPLPAPVNEPMKEPVIASREPDRSQGEAGEASAAAATGSLKIYTQKSILERFKEYRGQRTPEAFVALFNQDSLIGCRQEPPIVLSDGKSTVSVSFISTPGNMAASDVAVLGARLLSLKRDPDNTNTWVAELLPEKGTVEASITVSLGEMKMIYPLTVAPRINAAASQGTGAKGKDLSGKATVGQNREGEWDYRKDYILTANYLAGLTQEQSPQ